MIRDTFTRLSCMCVCTVITLKRWIGSIHIMFASYVEGIHALGVFSQRMPLYSHTVAYIGQNVKESVLCGIRLTCGRILFREAQPSGASPQQRSKGAPFYLSQVKGGLWLCSMFVLGAFSAHTPNAFIRMQYEHSIRNQLTIHKVC